MSTSSAEADAIEDGSEKSSERGDPSEDGVPHPWMPSH